MQALDLITDALKDIGVVGQTAAPSAEQGSHAVGKLNDVMASLLEDGVDLGWVEIDSTTDTVVIPVGHVSTIKALLSVALSSIYGADVPPAVAGKASSGHSRLLGQAFSLEIARSQSSTLPAGQMQRDGSSILNG